jgi:serine/threonine-protein kinase
LSSHRTDIPDDLQQVVLRCLAKSPADRYADAKELEQAFADCADAGEWNSQKAAAWWHRVCCATNNTEVGVGQLSLM